MQNKITYKNLAGLWKTICVVLCIALSTATVSAQTVSTATGTNYNGDYSINNPGSLFVTFVVENTSAAPLALTSVSTQMAPYFGVTAGTVATTRLYHSSTSLSGVMDLSTAAWTLDASGTASVPAALAVVQVISGANVIIPPATQYRFAVEVTKGLAFSFTPTPTPNTFTNGGVTLKVGTFQVSGSAVGYAGVFPAAPAGNAGAFFGGSVTLSSTVPCAGTPAPGNTVSSSATVCPNTAFTLSPQNTTTGSGVTYQWQSSATGVAGSFTDITGATNGNLTIPNLTTATFYQVKVTCSGNTGTSTPVEVGITPSANCYCTPPNSDCSDGDDILNVTFGTLNNPSTCSSTGYTNYTTNPAITVPEGIIGGANKITVKVGVPFLLPENIGVWIDYNKNGQFEASEFTLVGASATGGDVSNFINIPSTATAGVTRMRVRCRWNTAITGTDACTVFAYGETEDYNVNLVPCVPITITTHPANKTADCGTEVKFTAATAGSLPAYQWEYRTSSTSTNWIHTVDGAVYQGSTTNTLTIPAATANMNGYEYRVVTSGACSGFDFSNIAKLTVNPLVATVNPAAPSICLGSIQQLSITNQQPATVVTFSSNPNLNITIPDIASTVGINNTIAVSGIPAGVNITSIKVKTNIKHDWVGDMIISLKAPGGNTLGLDYALGATGGDDVTTGFTNTVIASNGTKALSAGTDPWSETFKADGFTNASGGVTGIPTGPNGYVPNVVGVAGWTNLYTVGTPTSLNGNWTIAMYDYYDDYSTSNKFNNWSIEITYTGGLASGVWTSPAPNSLYTDAAATIPYDGTSLVNTVYAKPTTAGVTNYTVVVNNGTCTSAPLTVPVTAKVLPTAVSAVANKSICPLGSTTFTAVVTGGTSYSYQWQVSTNGGATYTDVANNANYSGATTGTLTVTNAPSSFNANVYRLALSAAPCAGTLNSVGGTLTITPNPTLVIAGAPTSSVYPSVTTSVVVAVNPAPTAGTTYSWTYNGAAIAGATTNTVSNIGIDQLGTYAVTVTDGNGCKSTASTEVGDEANSTLFIYPNPTADGKFHVRYYDVPGLFGYQGKRTLVVFDSKGSKVYSKSYSPSGNYTDMVVDLSNHVRGIYTVDVLDNTGGRLKTGRVVVQ